MCKFFELQLMQRSISTFASAWFRFIRLRR